MRTMTRSVESRYQSESIYVRDRRSLPVTKGKMCLPLFLLHGKIDGSKQTDCVSTQLAAPIRLIDPFRWAGKAQLVKP